MSIDLTAVAHFGDYWPPDFGWGGAHDPEQDGSLIVPLTFAGVNFPGGIHRDAHGLFTALLTELVPLIPGGLHSGSCGAFTTGDPLPDGTRSFHSFGLAIDVNWNVNHMGTNIPDATGQYAVPRAAATALARKYGLEWGGNWLGGYHDNMHFECHLTPDVARTVTAPIITDEGDDDMAWDTLLTPAELQIAYGDPKHAPVTRGSLIVHMYHNLNAVGAAVQADLAVDKADLAADKPATP